MKMKPMHRVVFDLGLQVKERHKRVTTREKMTIRSRTPNRLRTGMTRFDDYSMLLIISYRESDATEEEDESEAEGLPK